MRPGLNPSPCNRQFGYQRICYKSRAEISARDVACVAGVIGEGEGEGERGSREKIIPLIFSRLPCSPSPIKPAKQATRDEIRHVIRPLEKSQKLDARPTRFQRYGTMGRGFLPRPKT